MNTCVSISAFASLIGIAAGIASSAVGIKICTIAAIIKKYKSITKKKDANRILSLNDCDIFEKPERNVKEVLRLTVIDGEMQ